MWWGWGERVVGGVGYIGASVNRGRLLTSISVSTDYPDYILHKFTLKYIYIAVGLKKHVGGT